jgi:hypothetical protein
MEKSLLGKCIENFESFKRDVNLVLKSKDYYSGRFRSEIKWVSPDTPSSSMPPLNRTFFNQQPSEKEFFEDRPWLPKDEAVYIQHLKDRLALMNEYRREVKEHDSNLPSDVAYEMLKRKKNS